MKNPFKYIKTHFGKKPASQIDMRSEDTKKLELIWPYGTWQKAGWPPKDWRSMDVTVWSTIYDAWWLEYFGGDLKIFKTTNPAMLGQPDPIPADWLPSEKLYKIVAVHKGWDTGIVHYIIGQLTHLKHIRP